MFSFSQTWPNYYGQSNIYNYSDDIIEQYDKGFLICGNIYSVGNQTTQQSWLIKTNINGDTIWEKIIEGGDDFIRTTAIDQTTDGGILCCGLVWTATGQNDPYIMKLNSCGEKMWCKVFTGSLNSNVGAQDIKETFSGEIIVLMNQFGEYGYEDMYLFKLNSYGDVLWQGPYCSGYEHPEGAIPRGKNIKITSQDEYLIAGQVYWEDPWNPGGDKGLRAMFTMVDSMGAEKWVLPFGIQDTILGEGQNIYELNDNSFIGLVKKLPSETMQTVLLEFDSLGNTIQYVIIDNDQIGSEISKGAPLDFERNDSVYVLGGIYGVPGTGYSTEIILDTNIFSNLIIYDHFQHINEEEPYTMGITNDGKIISNSTFKESGNWDISLSKLNLDLEYDTLYPGTYTYDSLCTEPGLPQSGFIFLDDCDIITGIDVPSPEEYYAHLQTIPISVYPNPTRKKVNFAMENTRHHKDIALKCFGLMGNIVYETTVATGQTETSTTVSDWPQGMYVAVIYSNGFPVGECKFVVQ